MLTPRWSIAFEPAAAFLFNDDEIEFNVLTRALEYVPVQWQMEIVTSAPQSTIVQLAGRHRTPFLARPGGVAGASGDALPASPGPSAVPVVFL
jgi:hypothetical protein